MEHLSIFKDIGSAVGIPAMLLVFWMYNRIKDLEKRLNEGNIRFLEIERKLASIAENVSFIRGKIEDK